MPSSTQQIERSLAEGEPWVKVRGHLQVAGIPGEIGGLLPRSFLLP